MPPIEDIANLIRRRDVEVIVDLFFERGRPIVRSGFRTENDLWDYKGGCPKPGTSHVEAWSELALDVLAFHNARGGILVFGIRDTDFAFCGTSHRIDAKMFNDQIRKFLPDRIWIDFSRHFIQEDQRYLGLALVPPRGPIIERFQTDAPLKNGNRRFLRGDSALREHDSSKVIPAREIARITQRLTIPSFGRPFVIDEPFFRVLSPEYPEFTRRTKPCQEVLDSLQDRRTAITSIIGGGGSGKTALATWAVMKAYEDKSFGFIVSITAKDRELTSSGIQSLDPRLTTFENLLDSVLEVLQFPDLRTLPTRDKEISVRNLLDGSNGLLYVDNLETVDDARVIEFLDSLPIGVRAITTSRRTSVRVAARPLTLGGLTHDESILFLKALSTQPRLEFASALSDSDRATIGSACDGLPLAIKWLLSNSRSAAEALFFADKVSRSVAEDEELLEFCFRRVFDAMTGTEKAILNVLALFQRPMNTETLLVGAAVPQTKLIDATEDLISDAVVQRFFDAEQNNYTYALLPITRAFVRKQLSRQTGLEDEVRTRLSDYFEARDITDPRDRLVIREVRQGRAGSDTPLVDLAIGAQRRGDSQGAKALFQQALARNPRSWNAARQFAEYYRHVEENISEALRLYEQAAANSPSIGPERSLIYREWGMLLKDSGDPLATDQAISCFEAALAATPDDPITIHSLALMLARKSQFERVISLLNPLSSHHSQKTRDFARSLLLLAYQRTNDLLNATRLKSEGVTPWIL